jgi:hypothetical protein
VLTSPAGCVFIGSKAKEDEMNMKRRKWDVLEDQRIAAAQFRQKVILWGLIILNVLVRL